jgi:co-chaperonin GroES (HSP10)
MKALYDFIVEPLGERYANKIKIGDKELVLNTNIENHKFVNSIAKVLATPVNIETKISKGDILLIHHNVFRRFYDIRGNEKNSRAYFKDNKYFVSMDQVFMFYNDGWKSFGDRCFVKPLQSDNTFITDNRKKNYGVLVYGNDQLKKLNVNEGDVVNYKDKREFEFVINKELVYCMKSNDILINHGQQRDEKEYNTSWAQSG